MSFLIDTHIYIWWVSEPRKLNPDLIELLSKNPNQVYVSTMVIWEMCIKQTIGKITFEESVLDIKSCTGFRTPSIQPEHAIATRRLPPIHRDPFDRIMLAQALHEGMAFVTHDHQCLQYVSAELRLLDATKV